MKPMMITQQDEMGCGAACVAYVANISYEHAASMLGKDKASSVGFRCKELTNVLTQLGHPYIHKHTNSIQEERLLKQNGTIVFIKRSSRYPYGHYLVRYGDRWGDPWINLVTNKSLSSAKAGFRKRLPGQVQWVLLPIV